MSEHGPPERYPWWVRFALTGARRRTSQWICVIAAIGVGAALLVFARDDPGPGKFVFLLAGLWGFTAAGLYGATIRWMDRHGRWN